MIRIIESMREGLQGVETFIPTSSKIRFANQLLKAGFDTVEIGSIVNPGLVPQMADTTELIGNLDLAESTSERMVLVLSRKGAEKAAPIGAMTTLSYPFSFSHSFLQKNVRSTVEDVFAAAADVINICGRYGKKSVIYISYAYGNPYGDPWSIDLLLEWIGKLRNIGAQIIPLSNVSLEIDPITVDEVFRAVIREYPDLEFGLHLHHGKGDWLGKVEAAYLAGCCRFDTVINGFGGCPLSGHTLMGNLATQDMISFLDRKGIPHGLDLEALREAVDIANEIY